MKVTIIEFFCLGLFQSPIAATTNVVFNVVFVTFCRHYVDVGRRTTMLPFLLLPQLQTLGPLPLTSGKWPVKKN